MLNKQLFTVAIVSILCCAAVQVDGAKPAKGGGGNHMQRGIQLAQQKHFDAAAEEFGKAIEQTIRKIRADTQIAAPPIAREHELPSQREIQRGPPPGIKLRWRILQNTSSWRRRMPPVYEEHGQTLSELKQYDAALADLNKALELKPDDLNTIKFRGFAEIGLQPVG